MRRSAERAGSLLQIYECVTHARLQRYFAWLGGLLSLAYR